VEPSSAPWRVVEPTPEGSPAPPAGARRDPPWVAIGAALVAVVVAVSVFVLGGRPEPGVEVDGALASPAVTDTASGHADAPGTVPIVVEVGGAVVAPGVYRLPPGSRILDAITAAGGFGPRVDATLADRLLNLASPVKDGDEVHVPVRGEASDDGAATAGGGGSRGGTGPGGSSTGPIDLNTASAEQLDTLPGVGPATVAKIIAAREERPFASLDDVGTRKVLGPATLEKIRPLATVTP
jgi:competence protein ComEA